MTGTGRFPYPERAKAVERCCPSTIHAHLLPSLQRGSLRTPESQEGVSPKGVGPRDRANVARSESASRNAVGNRTTPLFKYPTMATRYFWNRAEERREGK